MPPRGKRAGNDVAFPARRNIQSFKKQKRDSVASPVAPASASATGACKEKAVSSGSGNMKAASSGTPKAAVASDPVPAISGSQEEESPKNDDNAAAVGTPTLSEPIGRAVMSEAQQSFTPSQSNDTPSSLRGDGNPLVTPPSKQATQIPEGKQRVARKLNPDAPEQCATPVLTQAARVASSLPAESRSPRNGASRDHDSGPERTTPVKSNGNSSVSMQQVLDIVTKSSQLVISDIIEDQREMFEKMSNMVGAIAETQNRNTVALENVTLSVSNVDAVVQNLITSLTMQARHKDPKTAFDVLLFPLKDALTFERLRTYITAVFVDMIAGPLSSVKDVLSPSQLSCVHDVFETIFYTRLPSQKKAANVEGVVERHLLFRKNIILVVLGKLARDREAGVVTYVKGGAASKTAKPFWMSPGFVRSEDVETYLKSVLVERDGKESTKNEKKATTIDALHEAKDDALAQEICRRINQQLTQILNKGSEHARNYVAEAFGAFYFDNEDKFTFEELPCTEVGVDLSRIDASTTFSSVHSARVPMKTVEANENIWKELLQSTSNQLSFIVSYKPDVEMGNDRYVAQYFRKELRTLPIALSLLMRITGHTKPELFLSVMPSTFKCTYIVATMITRILQFCVKRKMNEIHSSSVTEQANDKIMSILVPPSNDAIQKIAAVKVLRMSCQTFNKLNVPRPTGTEDASQDASGPAEDDEFESEETPFDTNAPLRMFDHLG